MITEPITLDEWSFISGLRDIPDDHARADLTARLHDLIRYAHDPQCPRAQADGVPCTSVTVCCDQCPAREYPA